MSSASHRSVLIMAGGTGGHVFPALATANYLREQGINVEWLGTRRGIESRVVPAADISIHYIGVSGLRGKGIVSLFKAGMQMFNALFQSLKILRQIKPVCVLGMGGFVSGPGGMAAWLTGRPLVIHEQNAVAGTANKLLSHLSKKVLTGYPIALGEKSEFIGNPIRADIVNIIPPQQRYDDRAGRIRLLVLGGSLGAKPINDILPETISLIAPDKRPDVWHQTGEQHIDSVRNAYQGFDLEVKAEAFIEDMTAAYEWADLVICRSGALTVAEIAATGVASILVPLPHAIDDHQTENARWLFDSRAAFMLKQSEMDVGSLTALVTHLSDRSKLQTMAINAREVGRIDAAQRLASTCLEVANG